MNTSTYTTTNALPTNVFDLKHDDFYNFVEHQCGIIQAKILKFQLISDVDTFIECDDPTEILKYNSEKLVELKAESCLLIDDQSYIVLPGIIGSFNSLKKRLLKKNEQDIKQMKKNTNILNTSTPSVATTTIQTKTIDELRSHINKSIEQWIIRYRQDLDLRSDSSLVESIDYLIEFKDNTTGQQSAIITCSCGSGSSLNRSGNTSFFQLSNYYPDLEKRSCSSMMKKVNNHTNQNNNNDRSNANSQISQNSIDSSTSSLIVDNSNRNRNKKRSLSTNPNTRSWMNKRKRM